jgi:hypothetical protein
MYNRKNPSLKYLELNKLYKQMHIEGDKSCNIPPEYTFDGKSLLSQAPAIKSLCYEFNAKSILDYGCGKGRQYKKIAIKNQSGEVLCDSMQKYWNVDKITLYDPAFEPYNNLPIEKSDGVICTDVLEHIPQEDIDWVIEELFSFANKFIFANIACFPAKKHLPNGENTHCTIKESQWWQEKINKISKKYPNIQYKFLSCYKK